MRDITDDIRDLKKALDRIRGEAPLVLVFDGPEGKRTFEIRGAD